MITNSQQAVMPIMPSTTSTSPIYLTGNYTTGQVSYTLADDLQNRAVDLACLQVFNEVPTVKSFHLWMENSKTFIRTSGGKGSDDRIWGSLRGVKAHLRHLIIDDKQACNWVNIIPMEMIVVSMDTIGGMKRMRARTLFSTLDVYKFPNNYDRVKEKIRDRKFIKDKYDCWLDEEGQCVICKDEEKIFMRLTEEEKTIADHKTFCFILRDTRVEKKFGNKNLL